jgi:thiosulfate dehydrogenase
MRPLRTAVREGLRRPLLLAALALLGACPDTPPELRFALEEHWPNRVQQSMDAAAYGERLFEDPRLSASRFNAFSCATCHSTAPLGEEARLLPGYTLHGVTTRPPWWGGQELHLLDAVNFCLTSFMRAEPLGAEEPRARALYEYLASLGPAQAMPALPLTVVKDIREVPRGTQARGAQVYRDACQGCHGEVHTGKGQLTELAPVLPSTSEHQERFPDVPAALLFIEKVRHGRFYGIGGVMPLYGLEALSDEQLGALLAYLEL